MLSLFLPIAVFLLAVALTVPHHLTKLLSSYVALLLSGVVVVIDLFHL